MIMAVLHYPALAASPADLAADKAPQVPFFESIPGLIDKTWAQDEAGRGISVYHFEDRTSADAWFGSERQREFRRANDATIDFYEVGTVAVQRHLRGENATGR